MNRVGTLNAILSGVQGAVTDLGRRTHGVAIVTLDAVRTPDGTGYRITLVVDIPDSSIELTDPAAR